MFFNPLSFLFSKGGLAMTLIVIALIVGGVGVGVHKYGSAKKDQGKLEVMTELDNARMAKEKRINANVRGIQQETYLKKKSVDDSVRKGDSPEMKREKAFELLGKH